MKIGFKILIIVGYFCISWLAPWPESLIPTYLIFDIAFSIAVLVLMKEKLIFKFTNCIEPLLLTLILAIITLLLLSFFGWQTPFVYIANYEIKLIVLAPIIEELLFRGAFHSLLRKHLKRQSLLITSSLIFALSHFYSFFTTPNDFHPFILFQTGYTFILGYLLSKDFEENLNFTRVILMHFLFNAFFLVAIKTQMIN